MTGGQDARVTVGLPVHNGGRYLREALGSLLAQTYPRLRIVVCDNASDDETPEICAEYAELHPSLTYRRNVRNIGAAANFNLAAQLCETEYFVWANHDDLWDTDYVARCVAALDENPEVVLAYTQSHKINDDGCRVAPLMHGLVLDSPRPDQRLRRFHDWFRHCDRERLWATSQIEGLWTPIYGVMRTAALHRTDLIGSYISSDTILLEELLMHGRFAEIGMSLFGKRDHGARSMRDSRAYERRLAWFNGRRAGRFLFPKWRLLRGRLQAVARSSLPPGQRLACLVEMLAFYLRRPHEGKSLIKEILINLTRTLRWRSDRPGPLERLLPEVW